MPRSPFDWFLLVFGFAGQFIFFMRFAVQWYVSEKRQRSHVPVAFWYLSLAGGAMIFTYAWLRGDIVFTISQALGLFIYIRNLMLIHARKTRVQREVALRAERP